MSRESVSSAPASDYPEVLQVEVTTRCNLNCTFCQARPPDVRARGDLEYTTYERVLDQLRTTIDRVNLWGAGEPMLHPRFFDMAAKARDLALSRARYAFRWEEQIALALDPATARAYAWKDKVNPDADKPLSEEERRHLFGQGRPG